MDILEVISLRKSIRNYLSEPVEESVLETVLRVGETAEALTQAELRFHIRTWEVLGKVAAGFLGDYGKVNRAPHYIVLTARESPGYMADSGYRFEQMVLDAASRELGTCWVGGNFSESSVRTALGLDDSWRVVALTPIGYPADAGFLVRAINAVAGSSSRKPVGEIFFWERHGEPLPANIMADDRMARVLEATRRAPSWANKQPWRFLVTGREILIYKQTSQMRDGKDYHLLDCGIAMAHLHLAARALGMGGQWKLAEFEIPGAPGAEPVARYTLEHPLG